MFCSSPSFRFKKRRAPEDSHRVGELHHNLAINDVSGSAEAAAGVVASAVAPGCVVVPSVASRAGGAVPAPVCVRHSPAVALTVGAPVVVSAVVAGVPAPAWFVACLVPADASGPGQDFRCGELQVERAAANR